MVIKIGAIATRTKGLLILSIFILKYHNIKEGKRIINIYFLIEKIVTAEIRNMAIETILFDLSIKMFEKHQIIQHNAENVSVSFIIPEPQKQPKG